MSMEPTSQTEIFDLYDLLLEQLRDLYDGEKQQTEFLTELSESAESTDLQDFLEYHLRETNKQILRMQEVFDFLKEEPEGEMSDGIKGLILEANKLAQRCLNNEVRDAALVTAIQHINHYEMAGYGTAVAYAKNLDRHEVAEMLLETLREEKRADMGLSELAENQINVDAKWSSLVKKIEPTSPS